MLPGGLERKLHNQNTCSRTDEYLSAISKLHQIFELSSRKSFQLIFFLPFSIYCKNEIVVIHCGKIKEVTLHLKGTITRTH